MCNRFIKKGKERNAGAEDSFYMLNIYLNNLRGGTKQQEYRFLIQTDLQFKPIILRENLLLPPRTFQFLGPDT